MAWGHVAAAGIAALPGIIGLFRGNRGPQINWDAHNEHAQSLNDQMTYLNKRIGTAYQDFSKNVASATPSMNDLVGASYARGGKGSIAGAQRMAAMQRGQVAAYQGYNQHVDMLEGQKRNLSSLIGQHKISAGNLGLMRRQHEYMANQNRTSNQIKNALLQSAFSLAGHAGSMWLTKRINPVNTTDNLIDRLSGRLNEFGDQQFNRTYELLRRLGLTSDLSFDPGNPLGGNVSTPLGTRYAGQGWNRALNTGVYDPTGMYDPFR